MSESYVPDCGDIIWLNLSPTSGHEQSGHRPFVTLTPAEYNQKRGLLVCCPITTRVAGYPFEVAIDGQEVSGVAIADQIRTIDWRARGAKPAGKANQDAILELKGKLKALLLG